MSSLDHSRTCAAIVQEQQETDADVVVSVEVPCPHLRAASSDLCYGHKSIEDHGGEVRRFEGRPR